MDGIQTRLADLLSHRWSALLVRGLVAIGLGLLVWAKPGISLSVFVVAFGIWALVDGIVTVWLAIEDRPQQAWGWMLLEGLLGIVVGLVALARPGATAVALLFLIGFWAVARIASSNLRELVITDSIMPTEAVRVAQNIRVLSIAPRLREYVACQTRDQSASSRQTSAGHQSPQI